MLRRARRAAARCGGAGAPGVIERVAAARALRLRVVGCALLALLTLAVATGSLAARADASIYWANSGTGAIGRANLDGTGVSQSFITGAGTPQGVAVDGAHIYWTDPPYLIWRANLDGTGVNPDGFITVDAPGDNQVQGVAVDSGHVYWANLDAGMIGRGSLDGTGVNQSFISGNFLPYGVAVDRAHIYFTSAFSTIVRANLDGTGIDPGFITSAQDGQGVAVDGAHIYWANLRTGTIGRANLDGTGVNASFITGASDPDGVAVDGAHIYWANRGAGTIGRANLDGTDVQQSFITGANAPEGVAVEASVGALLPAAHFVKVSPRVTNPGETITVSGLVGKGCQTGHKGDRAIVYSTAFKGAARRNFARVPAVYVSLRKSKHRAFSFRLKLSKKLKTGIYRIGGRCGGGTFGSTRLKVVKAFRQTPPPASLRLVNNAYPCSHGSCWGTVSGSGLKSGARWTLIDDDNGQTLESGFTDHNGNLSQPLDVPCSENGYLVVDSTTAAGDVIESNGILQPADC